MSSARIVAEEKERVEMIQKKVLGRVRANRIREIAEGDGGGENVGCSENAWTKTVERRKQYSLPLQRAP